MARLMDEDGGGSLSVQEIADVAKGVDYLQNPSLVEKLASSKERRELLKKVGMYSSQSAKPVEFSDFVEPPHKVGSVVHIHGMKNRADLNGRTARIIEFDEARWRYNCLMDDNCTRMAFIPANLKRAASLSPRSDKSRSASPSPARSEQADKSEPPRPRRERSRPVSPGQERSEPSETEPSMMAGSEAVSEQSGDSDVERPVDVESSRGTEVWRAVAAAPRQVELMRQESSSASESTAHSEKKKKKKKPSVKTNQMLKQSSDGESSRS